MENKPIKYYLALMEFPPQEKMAGGFGLRTVGFDKEHGKIVVHEPTMTFNLTSISDFRLYLSGYQFWLEDTPANRSRLKIIAELPLEELAELATKHFKENIKTIYELPTNQKLHEQKRAILDKGFVINPKI